LSEAGFGQSAFERRALARRLGRAEQGVPVTTRNPSDCRGGRAAPQSIIDRVGATDGDFGELPGASVSVNSDTQIARRHRVARAASTWRSRCPQERRRPVWVAVRPRPC